MAITVYTSTDMEQLGLKLAENLKANPPTDVFLQDIILVDGKAASNWLTRVIVGPGGLNIHMNAQLMNTRRFGAWVAAALQGQKLGRGSALDALPARIFRLLGEEPHREAWRKWSGVSDSGQDPSQEVIRWGLAFRLARHFQDLIRNDAAWIERAERGETAGKEDRWSPLWQAAIAETRNEVENGGGERNLVHDIDALHALTLGHKADSNLRLVASRLPGRLSLFVAGDVSATLLRTLKALSEVVPVDIYRLQPTEGLHDRMTMGGMLESLGTDEEDVDIDNPALPLLLAGGRYYRLQFEKFEDILDSCRRVDLPATTQPDTQIGRLKESLRVIATGTAHQPAEHMAKPAANISIHRCHGPLREVEVLRDQLLGTIQAAPKDRPVAQGEILVLTPKPEVYAPLLRAVLGSRAPFFEVGTANVYGAANSPFGALVKALVELPGSRVSASDIHSLLSMRALQARLGWGSDDLETIQEWFEEGPFCWGYDQAHRDEYLERGAPEAPVETAGKKGKKAKVASRSVSSTDNGTLTDFIKRLALGTAMGDRIEHVAGTLPAPGITGRDNLVLAKELGDVLEPLAEWIRASRTPETMTVAGWVGAFRKVTKLLPTGKDFVRENRELAQALQRIEAQARAMAAAANNLGAGISHSLFCKMLLDQCDFEAGSGQFLTGRVTLAPLRATSVHPSRIIAFVGMSDGAFPARSRGNGPEVAQEPKRGPDKAKTRLTRAASGAGCQEDTSMHAFMLALMAAKERVIATFDGYAGSTGKKASAALPVEILRRVTAKIDPEFAVSYHALADYQAPRAAKELEDEHADAATFDTNAPKVHAQLLETKPAPVIVPKVGGAMAELTNQQWAELWTQPVRSALRTLGIRTPRKRYAIDDQEPLEDTAAVAYRANDWLTRWRADVAPGGAPRSWPADAAAIREKAEALRTLRESSGMFPPGEEGQTLLEQLMALQAALGANEAALDAPLRTALGTARKPESHRLPGVKLPQVSAYANTDNGEGGVLVLTVEREPKWSDCLSGLAMLCKHDLEGRRYRKVTVLGLKGRDTSSKLETLLSLAERTVVVNDIGVARLKQGLGQLAASPLAADMPLLLELLSKSFEACLPNGDTKNPDKPRDVRMEDLMPVKGRPTPHENRIVMPEQFDFQELNRIAQEMFVNDGAIRRVSAKDDTPPEGQGQERQPGATTNENPSN